MVERHDGNGESRLVVINDGSKDNKNLLNLITPAGRDWVQVFYYSN